MCWVWAAIHCHCYGILQWSRVIIVSSSSSCVASLCWSTGSIYRCIDIIDISMRLTISTSVATIIICRIHPCELIHRLRSAFTFVDPRISISSSSSRHSSPHHNERSISCAQLYILCDSQINYEWCRIVIAMLVIAIERCFAAASARRQGRSSYRRYRTIPIRITDDWLINILGDQLIPRFSSNTLVSTRRNVTIVIWSIQS